MNERTYAAGSDAGLDSELDRGALVLWITRVIWAALPLTAGSTVSHAIAPWGASSHAVALVLAWAAWAAVLLSLAVPRPPGMTVARVGAPIAVATVLLAAWTGRPSTGVSAGGAAVAFAAWVGIASPAVGHLFAQGAAYGDEERFPLKVPPALFLGILPGVVAAIGLGVAVGPIMVADGRVLAGIPVCALGGAVVFFTGRAVHILARRWIVLVPGGLVVVDPMTLADPVLLRTERLQAVTAVDPRIRPPVDRLDLRLGALFGSLACIADADVEFATRARGRRGVELVSRRSVLVAPSSSTRVLGRARARGLPVLTASRARWDPSPHPPTRS